MIQRSTSSSSSSSSASPVSFPSVPASKHRRRLSALRGATSGVVVAAAFAAALSLGAPSAAQARDALWDNDGIDAPAGGPGQWDTATARWLISTDYEPWVGNEDAILGGQGGAVQLQEEIFINSLRFDAPDYAITVPNVITGTATAPLLTFVDTSSVIDTGAHTAEIFARIGGTGGYTKRGTGTLIFHGASNFANNPAGDIVIEQGTLALGNTLVADLPNASIIDVRQGATLHLGIFGGAYADGVGGITGNGNIILQPSPGFGIATGSTLTIGSNGSATLPTIDLSSSFAGNISGEGGRLTKAGSGTLTLSGSNTYTGVTNVTRGTLVLQGGNAIPDASGVHVTVSGGIGTNVVFEADETIGSLNGGNSQTIVDMGANDLTIGGDGLTTQFTGVLRGTGRLTKIGVGTQVFATTPSTWTGGVTVKGGMFIASADSRYGAAPDTHTPGHITLDGGGTGNFVGAPLDINPNRGIRVTERGTTIYAAGGGANVNSGAINYNGVIEGTGHITKTGPGPLNLGGQNTVSGGWTITDGAVTSSTTSGTPLGGGSIAIHDALLAFRAPLGDVPVDATVAIANAAPATTFSYGRGSTLEVNKSPANNSMTLTIGNAAATAPALVRDAGGGTLVIRYGTELGSTTGERVIVNGGAVPTTNGIVTPYILGARIGDNVGDFLTYDATDGFKVANYTANDVNTATPTDVVDVASPQTLFGNRTVYGLRTGDVRFDLGGSTLTIGNGSGPAAVVLNGGFVENGTLSFGSADGVIYAGPGAFAPPDIAARIAGTGGITKLGPGDLYLTGTSNTFSGGLRIDDGAVIVSDAGALPSSNVVTLSGAGRFVADPTELTIAGLRSNSRSSRVEIAGDLILRGDSTFRGVVTGNRLIKDGPGTLTLGQDLHIPADPSATNGFSKLVVRNGGVVSVSGVASLPNVVPSDNRTETDVITLDDGTLRITSINNVGLTTFSGFNLAAGTAARRTITVGPGGGTIDVTNPNELVFFQRDNATASPLLYGSGTLTKTGAGFLRLGPGNDNDPAVAGDGFTGKMRVIGGNLQFQNDSALGEAPATLVPDQLQIGPGAMIQSNGTGGIAATRGTTLLGGEALFNTSSGNFTFNGPITGAGGITKVGSGGSVLSLAAANDFQGNLKLLNGRVNLNASNAAGQGTIVLQPEYPVILGKSAGTDDSVIPNNVTAAAGSSISLQVDGASTGRLVLNGNVSGDAKRLFKTGIGNLVLGGNNTYTGETVVQQGTLTVTGATALGAAAGPAAHTVVNPGASLAFDNANHSGAEVVYIGGAGVADGGAIQSVGAAGSNFAGSVVATRDASIVAANPLAIAGGVRVGRNSTLTRSGPALLATGPVRLGNGATLSLNEGATTVKHVRGDKAKVSFFGDSTAAVAADGTDAGTSVLDTLEMSGTSGAWQNELDLTDNDLIVRADDAAERDAELAMIEDMIKTARDTGPGGRWTGKGLTSSAARANPVTGLVVAPNFGLTTFSGQSVGPDDVLVKYTYNGDANLDGRVNADDYFRIDQGFLSQPANPRYRDGDFNDDGRVNADDYFLIDQAFLGQGAPLTGEFGAGGVLSAIAVPEPGALSAILLGATGLLARRRRK